LITIIIFPVSGQAVVLTVTDREPLEEQESGGHPRVDVFLDRRIWIRKSFYEACYVAVTEELG
jgi:hypothetical protein